jgi:hypothetical protein
MGSRTSSSSTLNTSDNKGSNFNRSFEVIKNAKEEPALGLDKEEKKIIRHRYSETTISPNKGLRSQYFNKLHQNNQKEKEERSSLRSRATLRPNGTINNTQDNYDCFEVIDSNPESLYHSYVDKGLNSSMKDSSIMSDYFVKDSNKSQISLNRANSRHSRNSSRNIKNGENKKNIRKSHSSTSLSDVQVGNSYSLTKNTLYLLENEINLENVVNEVDLNLNLPRVSTKNFEINRRTSLGGTHKKNMSHESISVNSPFEEIFEEGGANSGSSSGKKKNVFNPTYDDKSMISTTNTNKLTNVNNDYELNFYRNGEDLRRSYIAKLIFKKIWVPSKKEKDHNTVIIFDWDDTLLCTSFLTPNGIFNEDLDLTDKEKEKLAKLEFSVLRILTAAVGKCDTFIITNAAPGWVEYSAERFYPSLKTFLPKVKIISARGEYEAHYPGDSRMWKIQAFLNMQRNFDSQLVTNIICLGDSFIEMEAAHVLASKFQQAFIKTIKFRESPKPEELNKQLTLVAEQFPVIFSAIKNLTIRVEKKIKR